MHEGSAAFSQDRVRTRDLRHPDEVGVVALCVALNLLLIAVAIALVHTGASWLARHPWLEHHEGALRAWATVGVLALPATVLGRRQRRYVDQGNGIRLSRTQLPECHALLVDACARLGVTEIPELYLVPRPDLPTMCAAFGAMGQRPIVALSTDLFGRHWRENRSAIAFAIGHAVGALRLGHTRWWLELLTSYAMAVPILRTPVRAVFTFSRDRCGAVVAPDGIRGLVIHAAGKGLVHDIDVPSFVEQALAYGGVLAWLAGATRRRPHLLLRARLLYEDGFFDAERDLARPATS